LSEHEFLITYKEDLAGTPRKRKVYVNQPVGETQEEQEQNVKERAQQVPDWSVEQVFLSSEGESEGNKSNYFTVRTVEKEAKLVQASIDRLFYDPSGKNKSLLQKIEMTYKLAKSSAPQRYFLWAEMKAVKEPPVGEATLRFWQKDAEGNRTPAYASPSYVSTLLNAEFKNVFQGSTEAVPFTLTGVGESRESRYATMYLSLTGSQTLPRAKFEQILQNVQTVFNSEPQPDRLENFDSALAAETRTRAIIAIVLSWGAILLYLWFRFGSWTFGVATVACLIHDLFFTLGIIALCHYLHGTAIGNFLLLEDFKLDLTGVAALLTLVGYSVSDTIVVFDRIREVRGKNPDLTPQMINDSVNQTLSRTLLTAFSVWLVVFVLYVWGGPGVHLFSFVMVVGVIVGTYSSIYIASPLLLIFGEGKRQTTRPRERQPQPEGATV
jgi:SecD/SecF fusion protein